MRFFFDMYLGSLREVFNFGMETSVLGSNSVIIDEWLMRSRRREFKELEIRSTVVLLPPYWGWEGPTIYIQRVRGEVKRIKREWLGRGSLRLEDEGIGLTRKGERKFWTIRKTEGVVSMWVTRRKSQSLLLWVVGYFYHGPRRHEGYPTRSKSLLDSDTKNLWF